jgi:hypothetical protein
MVGTEILIQPTLLGTLPLEDRWADKISGGIVDCLLQNA